MQEKVEGIKGSLELPKADPKDGLVPGAYCWHKSWGFGQIRARDELLGELKVDFEGKSGHVMDLGYARASLTLLPENHVLVQRTQNPEELKRLAQQNPVALVRLCVESLGEKASVENLQSILSPSVIPKDAWKKWWEGTKKLLRKSRSFQLPSRKGEPIRYVEASKDSWQKSLEEFRSVPGRSSKIRWLARVLQAWEPGTQEDFAQALLAEWERLWPSADSAKGSETLELMVLQEELMQKAGQAPGEGLGLGERAACLETGELLELLERLSSARRVRVLKGLLQLGDHGLERILELLPLASPSVLEAVERTLEAGGVAQKLDEAVQKHLEEQKASSDFLYWLCKSRREILFSQGVRILWFILLSLEKDLLAENRKPRKLYELLQNDRELVSSLLQKASLEEVREVTRAILLSPVFKELDKRSLLGSIVKAFPEVGELLSEGRSSSGEPRQEGALWVTQKSLEVRRAELKELLEKKIPQVSQDIAIARSYGDLRENHEYKAAKEMQGLLLKRKAELEEELTRARVIDFASVSTASVGIGTRVRLRGVRDARAETLTILGAWDSNPARGILSYLTDRARLLLGKKVGELVELPVENGELWQAEIEAIEVAKEEES